MDTKYKCFSIIMPVYNVEAYVADSIASVLNQTFRNFELIVVNDGSVDGSMHIVENMTANDRRVHIINQSNTGLSGARNTGLDYATGEYLYFMDSDDIIEPDMLQEIYQLILSENKPDMIAFTAKSFISGHVENAEDKIRFYDQFYSRDYIPDGIMKSMDYYALMHEKDNFVASVCLFVARAELIQDNKIKFMKGIIHEDELFTRQLLLLVESVYFQKVNYYHRRVRPGSITQLGVSKHKILSLLQVADAIMDLYKKTDIVILMDDVDRFYNRAMRLMESLPKKR